MLSKTDFNRLFPLAFTPDAVAPYIHQGEWAIHDVLPILLDVAGPCELRVITFNISAESITAVATCEKLLTDVKLLLDTSIRRNKLDMLLFAQNVATQVRLGKVHAKLFLVSNARFRFGIAGSANFNSNRRLESGFYFTDPKYFDYFQTEFDKHFKLAEDNDI